MLVEEGGADPNRRDGMGNFPLYYAVVADALGLQKCPSIPRYLLTEDLSGRRIRNLPEKLARLDPRGQVQYL